MDANSLLSFEYDKPKNILPLNQFSIGRKAKKILSSFPDNDQTVFLYGVKRFLKICDELKKNLPLKNQFLANLRFLKPENRNIDGEKMILGCAKFMPQGCKFTSSEMDALSLEWKHLVLQDIPEIPKIGNHIPVVDHWKAIFEIVDEGEPRFPLIEKVVWFARSIAEANDDVDRLFSQIFHIISKDRTRLETHT